jgi:anion-transporting  ArsA/GET3 family ATPase
MWSPDDKRFVFVTGKGGVGKTTVTAAMARALAARGKRVLIAMCNTKERISAMFGSPPVGADIIAVAERIWAVNIEPHHAFEEYGRMVLKVPGLYRVVFDNKYVRSFLPAVPGLSEWAMLGKAWFHTTETDARGVNRFDVVLLDAPATGHGLDMLRVPKVILEVVPPGILRRDAELAWKMFQDPAQTSVVVVTLAEELPISETIGLMRSVERELALPLGTVVVNGVLDRLFTDEERGELAKVRNYDAEVGEVPGPSVSLKTPAEIAVGAAARRALREGLQAESLRRLDQASDLRPIPRVVLPLLFEDAASPAAIARLAALF